jgi:hypothetical protein
VVPLYTVDVGLKNRKSQFFRCERKKEVNQGPVLKRASNLAQLSAQQPSRNIINARVQE